ncbi:MAG: hypothetical protein DMD83_01625 [Candidatus Rokuibacteriota bacterium]|nr:MAG: hypothetical protein DMD83_01625 [Candidatus Rokubacteria bacterium]
MIPPASSRRITVRPFWLPRPTGSRVISPRLAQTTMSRASSEMVVATTVASPGEKPSPVASIRTFRRAATISVSASIKTWISSDLGDA